MIKNYQKQLGFTLIEMIVSLAVFSVVITMSVGALLILISTNQQLQVEQTIMTNLSFALDSMTREIRTGTHYYCASRSNYTSGVTDKIFGDTVADDHEALGSSVKDCPGGRVGANKLNGISFREAGSSITGSEKRILYFFDDNVTSGTYPNGKKIMRRVGNNPAQPVTSSGMEIIRADFYVSNSGRLATGETDQPSVTIFIEAKEKNPASTKIYRVQTTITQRTLDI